MTKTDILDAINLLLVRKWPQRTVYVDVCPVDFERPSFWLAVEKHEIFPANRHMDRHELQLRLTLYDALDEHYEASWHRLSTETDTLTAMLAPCLKVGERHISLRVKMLPRDPDRAYIQINTSWMDERPGMNAEDIPPASAYALTVEAK